jgi:mannose-6-phosphate isomerase-like protein (cupin superfamily)
MNAKMENPYLLRAENVPTDVISGNVYKAGSRTAQVVYTTKASIMVTTRSPGYHSRASAHEGDELDYVTAGEMWLFIGKTGFKIKAGDFVRIPGGEMHWAWVTGNESCTMIHVHTPPFIGNPGAANTAVGMLTAAEIQNGFQVAKDIFDDNFPMDEVERSVMGESR